MTDRLGWRRKFGVIAPSTNTIVEPEFDTMTVPGVTSHFSGSTSATRTWTPTTAWSSCSSRSATRSAAPASGC